MRKPTVRTLLAAAAALLFAALGAPRLAAQHDHAAGGDKPIPHRDGAWDKELVDLFGAIPIQDGGRVMPLDTYARNLSVQLTGRSTRSPAS